MDEKTTPLVWWQERLLQWQEMGYQTERIESKLLNDKQNASELVLFVERCVNLAEDLRNEISSLNDRYAEFAIAWLDLLDDPMNVELVQEEFDKFNLSNRPWAIDAKASVRNWENTGKVEELESIVSRLDLLDPVFIAKGSLLGELFDNSNLLNELDDAVQKLEESQVLRWNNLENMVASLYEKGVNAELVLTKNLGEAYELVGKLEQVAEKIDIVKKEVSTSIEPFSRVLAEEMLSRINSLNVDSEEEIRNMMVEVEATARDLDLRHLKVGKRLRTLTISGFILPPEISSQRQDMLYLESVIESLEKRSAQHDELIGKATNIAKLWRPLNESVLEIGGDLSKTIELEQLIAAAEQELKSIRIQAEEQISSWSELGFDMSAWRSKIESSPVEGMVEWQAHLHNLRSSLELVRRLEDLDISLSGIDKVENHVSNLQMAIQNPELVALAQSYVEKKALRNERHRRMLIREIKELRLGGYEIISNDIDSLNLKELEYEVHSSTSNIGLSSATSTVRIPKMPISAIENEINGWSNSGWNVSNLLQLLHSDPLHVGALMDSIREEMGDFANLMRRLERLPYGSAPNAKRELESNLKHPERLANLKLNLSELAAVAALEAKGERRRANLWRPKGVISEEVIVEDLEDMDLEVLQAAIQDMEYIDQSYEDDALLEVVNTKAEVEDEKMIEAPLIKPEVVKSDMSIESANEALFEEEEDDSIPLPVLEPIYEVEEEKMTEAPLIEPEVVKSEMGIDDENEELFKEEEEIIEEPLIEPEMVKSDMGIDNENEELFEEEEEIIEEPLIEPEMVKSDMGIDNENEELFEEEEDDSMPLPVLEPIYEVEEEKMAEAPLIEPEVGISDMSIEGANEALFEEEEDDSIPLPGPITEVDDKPLPELPFAEEVKEDTTPPPVLEPILEENNASEVDIEGLQSIVAPINLLFNNLGLGSIPENIEIEDLDKIRFDLAANVGIIPRDTRVDRLLRLALRLIPRGAEADLKSRAGLIQLLAVSARNLDKWTDLRLRARGSAGKGKLLIDSRNLGKILNRIPGPGVSIPLKKDIASLSSSNNLNGLATEVGNLCNISNLDSGSGVKAV